MFSDCCPFDPPHTTIRSPVQTAVCKNLAEGALTRDVESQVSDWGSYRPPVPPPPQTTILLPAHTAVWPSRADGALVVRWTINPGERETVILLTGMYTMNGETLVPTFEKVSVEKSPPEWVHQRLEQIRKDLNTRLPSKVKWKSNDQVILKSPMADGNDVELTRQK